MAVVIDATVGGANSNSYLTVARANVLAETLPHMDDWLLDASINKAQLLVHATRMIDRYFVPDGSKVSSTQALWWPQSGLYYANTGEQIPGAIIPEFVELATMEWAFSLYQNPDPYSDVTDGLKMLDTPSYRMEFTGGGQKLIPDAVYTLLGPYTRDTLSSFVRVIRV